MPAEDKSAFAQALGAAFAGFLEEPPQIPDERVLNDLFRIFWHLGRTSESLCCIRLLEMRAELGFEALLTRGYWQLHVGDVTAALRCFEAARRKDATQQSLRLGYAYALFYAQDYAAAAREFQGLVDEGTAFQSAAPMAAANQALAEGRRPDLIVAAPVPGLPPGMNEVLQMRVTRGPDAALAEGQQRLRRLSFEEGLPLRRLLLELLLELGRNDQAFASANELQDSLPVDGTVSYLRGLALRRTGLADESHKMFERAILLAPFAPSAWSGFGAGWIERGDASQGAQMLRVSVFLDERNAHGWGDLGQAEALLEHWSAACDAFSRAIDLGERTFTNYMNRGGCYVALDNVTHAVSDWVKALEIDPHHRRAAEIRAKMGNFGVQTKNDYTFGELDVDD